LLVIINEYPFVSAFNSPEQHHEEGEPLGKRLGSTVIQTLELRWGHSMSLCLC